MIETKTATTTKIENETPETKHTSKESQHYYKSSSNHCTSDYNVSPSYRDIESGNCYEGETAREKITNKLQLDNDIYNINKNDKR